MTVTEMKTIYEKCTEFEKPNLTCNGGFGFGKGTLRFDPQDGEYHFCGEHNSHFIAKDEFVNKAINQNMRKLKDYFKKAGYISYLDPITDYLIIEKA